MKLPASPNRSGAVRAIFFDAGNTLLRINYADLAACLRARGIAGGPEAVASAEHRARVRLDPHLASDASTEDQRIFWHYVGYLLGELGFSDQGVVQSVYEWVRAYNPPVGLWNQADPEAEPLLHGLKARGLTLGVISNSNGSVRGILEELGLARYLDLILDSTVVGVEKPNPRIFRMALEAARLAPAQAVYIGDLYSVDVLGARSAGLRAILLDPGGVWSDVDCPVARSLGEAVALALRG
jgi:putative hydrolase of the HAD superfamily